MIYISHRGNLTGKNPELENSPVYIYQAIDKGFDVEIDLRYDTLNKKLYLGHDEPQYPTTWFWIVRMSRITFNTTEDCLGKLQRVLDL